MRKIRAVVVGLVAAAAFLLPIAQAQARHIPPIIGCGSLLDWPCPGPVIINP